MCIYIYIASSVCSIFTHDNAIYYGSGELQLALELHLLCVNIIDLAASIKNSRRRKAKSRN